MSQMMSLVKLMKEGEVTSEDCIFFEDMFQPGIESLPYIMDQVAEEHRPKVFVRCLSTSLLTQMTLFMSGAWISG